MKSFGNIVVGSCTVVIPTYNEENNVVNMAKAIRELYPEFHVMFMDDNSTDRSKQLIDELGDPLTRMVVRKPEERGLAASVFQGILECNTDYFMTVDCDFQHPLSTLKGMYEKMEAGADLVIGTRDDRTAMGFKRWAGSWCFTIFANAFLLWHGKPRSKDNMSGLIAGRTSVFVPVIKDNWNNLEMQGWKVLLDLLRWGPKDLKIDEEHYIFAKREIGESHISGKVVVSTFHQCGAFGRFCAKVYAKIKGLDYPYDQ